MLKYRIYLLLYLLPTLIRAEYILYKVDDKKQLQVLDEKDFKEAYQVLMRFQFPTSLCYQEKLTKEEEVLYSKDEERFLQNKLKDNIKIKYIPTILYELLFYKFYLEETSNSTIECNKRDCKLNKNEKDINKHRKLFIEFYKNHNFELGTKYIYDAYIFYLEKYSLRTITREDRLDIKKWNYSKYLQAIYDLINDKYVIQLHRKINNKIIEYLKHENTLNLVNLISRISIIVKEMQVLLNFRGQIGWGRNAWHLEQHHDIKDFLIIRTDNIKDFERLATIDYYSHKSNIFLIYRGTNGKNSNQLDSNKHRLSYGHSFLSGILHDISACPYYYFRTRDISYLLDINKFEYINQLNNCHEFFFIPPLTTLLSMCLKGELFHISSKVWEPLESQFFNFEDPGEFSYGSLVTGSNKSKKDFEESFQEYLHKNAILFKNETGLKLSSKL